MIPPTHGTWDRIVRTALRAAVRASLVVSPRPAALLVRRVFAADGARQARTLEAHAPKAVSWLLDEPYSDHPDTVLDVFRPTRTGDPLPAVCWIHGGAWVGGAKEQLAGYFKLLASHGYVVVAPSYSLAPEERYPTQARQLMQALAYVQVHAERLGIDRARLILAGDSTGAQLAAQLAALTTSPEYALSVGVSPTISREQLRGVVLACGPYDLALLGRRGSRASRRLVDTMLWAYSGHRDYLRRPAFATASIAQHVGPAFPPALVTVGNADPLREHSELLVDKLRDAGHQPETLFFHEQHQPALGHQYQFDLETEEAWRFLERTLSFMRRRVARPVLVGQPELAPAHHAAGDVRAAREAGAAQDLRAHR